MNRWKTVAGVMLILMLGGLIGSLTTGWVLKCRHPLFHKDPGRRVAFIMKRLARRLDLTENQKPAVEAVVRRIDARMRERSRRQHLEMHRLLDRETEALKPLLTPEQREEFDRYRLEIRARRRSHHPPPGRCEEGRPALVEPSGAGSFAKPAENSRPPRPPETKEIAR